MTATISPARSRAAASSIGIESRGPQTGQAIGSAWKRRSVGSSYSRRQSSHSGKPAMVVFGRSYGTSRTIVKRGPHWVQLMNAYPCRRSAGSNSSRRQSSHVATSAGTGALRPPGALARIAKARSPRAGSGSTSTASTRASGGASACKASGKFVEGGCRPLGLRQDALAVVQDEARQAVTLREAVDERPEAHALDDAPHADASPRETDLSTLWHLVTMLTKSASGVVSQRGPLRQGGEGTMCLAIPGRVLEIVDEANRLARVDVAGVRRNVNVGLLDRSGGVEVGDWVLIHVGFALSKVDEEEALATLRLLQRMGEAYEQELEDLRASVIE